MCNKYVHIKNAIKLHIKNAIIGVNNWRAIATTGLVLLVVSCSSQSATTMCLNGTKTESQII